MGTAVTSGCHRPNLHLNPVPTPHTPCPPVLWCRNPQMWSQVVVSGSPLPREVTTCHLSDVGTQSLHSRPGWGPTGSGKAGASHLGQACWSPATPRCKSSWGLSLCSEPHPLLREGFTQDLLPRVQAVGPEEEPSSPSPDAGAEGSFVIGKKTQIPWGHGLALIPKL